MSGPITRERAMYVIVPMLAALGILWGLMTTLQTAASAQTSLGESFLLNSESTIRRTDWGSVPEFTGTLAAFQAWFGLDSHIKPPPYVSTDTTVISGQIVAALAQGIDGFVVDWYGPKTGAPNDEDREFIDKVTTKLLQQSEGQGFHVALMYDEGTVLAAEALTTAYTTRVISDLLYAKQYFTMSSYLRVLEDRPTLFVFPYDTVDPYIDWAEVRNQLDITVALFDKDPDPYDPVHDAQFDGFFAWVQPAASGWLTDGTEWGGEYLRWFYDTMASPPYVDKVAIGGVWPGFDDTLASWGEGRYMWRRCGQTWRNTWGIATEYNPPIVMIDTWNDFEEGTDIEYGTGECLTPSREKCALPEGSVVYTHTLANTGKFTDTFNVQARSSNAWPTVIGPTSVTLVGHASTTLSITLTVPKAVDVGTQDTLIITATSELSTAVHSSVVNTTTMCGSFLPIIMKNYIWRFIGISGPAEVHSQIADVYGTWIGFPVEEVTVRLYAQEGNKYWCIQPSRAADVSSDHWTAEGQFGGVTAYGVFAVVASGNQLPGCAAAPGQNYVIASDEEQFRAHIRPYVYLSDERAVSSRCEISRVE